VEVKQDTADSLRAEDVRAVILWLCREPQEASSILMPLYIQLAEQAYKLGDDVLPLFFFNSVFHQYSNNNERVCTGIKRRH
jgi:hypothetical protein